MRNSLLYLTALSPLLLSACGYPDAIEAHKAQSEMVGMTSYDLQACAGLPGSTKALNGTAQIWQYSVSYSVPSLPSSGLIPISSIMSMINSIFGGPGSSCRMIVRLDHDRVSEIHYAGDDDEYIGRDGICSMITRGCARQPEATMHGRTSLLQTNPASGFTSPPTPPQSADATYSEQSGKYVPVFDGDKLKPVIRPLPAPPVSGVTEPPTGTSGEQTNDPTPGVSKKDLAQEK